MYVHIYVSITLQDSLVQQVLSTYGARELSDSVRRAMAGLRRWACSVGPPATELEDKPESNSVPDD